MRSCIPCSEDNEIKGQEEQEKLKLYISSFKERLDLAVRGPLDAYLSEFVSRLQSPHQRFYRAQDVEQLNSCVSDFTRKLKLMSRDLDDETDKMVPENRI
jgi:hypothetical protein